MISRIPILIVSLFQCSALMAAELSPFFRNDKLGATVRELKFPETISKDLVSGLSNKILIRFELTADSRVHSQRVADITIKYDLWDENFKVHLLVGDSNSTSKTIPSLKEVLSFLANLKIPNLWSNADLPKTGSLNLKADTLLNPVEKEQMEKIRKWVTQNSTSTPLDPTGLGSARPVALSRSNTLFNKIFEQYAIGANVASAWRETVSSKPFRLTEVSHEK